MRQRRYLAYLLRLWLAESAGEPVWRGSLEDPHTGARLGFADLASLFEYLRRQDLETLAQTLAVFAQNAGLPPAQFRADLHTLLTLAGHPHPDAVLAVQAQPVPPLQAPYGPRAQPAGRADWGRAPDVSRFVGRAPELAQLGRWLLQDRRRLLGVFGLGGIGKTFLTRRAALDAAPGFTAVKWVLLQDGPPPDEVLAECIHFFSGYRDTDLPPSTAGRLDRLLAYFRQARCLLVLDKLEAIMQPGRSAGHFRAGYEAYGDLLGAAAETEHRSCLVMIGREQPHDMARWEVQSLRAASLHLRGMDAPAAQAILQDAHIAGAPEEWAALVAHYAGNPLMLQLAAAPIRDLYAGRLGAFLAEERFAFGDVNDLLDEHFGRLATGEQDIMYWLAVERTALAVTDLVEHLLPRRPVGDVRSTLASLLRRHLTDRDTAGFFLQDIVLEYVTDRLVARMADELTAGQPGLFRRLPLLNPVTAEHRRLGQERFLVAPLAERLRQVWPATAELRQQLGHLAAAERSARPPGYTAGNALNLLRHAQADLTGADFSGVSIWRAFLRGLDLHRVSLARADLRETVFTEAFASVAALGLSQDGALLAAGADRGEIYLWRCRDFKRLFTLKGHNDWVRSVAFSPDGRLLASASSDKTIRLWDVLTGDCLRSLAGHENRVRAAVFSPDGTLLASASSDRTVRLWRVADGQLLHTLAGHAEVTWAARFSATGRWLASSSYDRTIRLWDGQTGEPLRVLDGHADAVLALAFHPIHDHLLASGSDDRTVRLWDARDGVCLHVFADHGDMVRSVTLQPGRRLAGQRRPRPPRARPLRGRWFAVPSLRGASRRDRGAGLRARRRCAPALRGQPRSDDPRLGHPRPAARADPARTQRPHVDRGLAPAARLAGHRGQRWPHPGLGPGERGVPPRSARPHGLGADDRLQPRRRAPGQLRQRQDGAPVGHGGRPAPGLASPPQPARRDRRLEPRWTPGGQRQRGLDRLSLATGDG